jgi:hypothetical protein
MKRHIESPGACPRIDKGASPLVPSCTYNAFFNLLLIEFERFMLFSCGLLVEFLYCFFYFLTCLVRIPALNKSLLFLLPVCQELCLYCFYTVAFDQVFFPCGLEI